MTPRRTHGPLQPPPAAQPWEAPTDEIAKELAEFDSPDPVPIGEKAPDQVSGKVLVRMPRTLHASLLAESEREGVSLNQLIVAKLAAHLSALA